MIDTKWIGHELPLAWATLERGRLRFFAQAIGETDPVYSDVDAARAAGYADLPAPPTFLMSVDLDAGTIDAMLALLEVPLARILHGEQGFTCHRAVCAGDTVTVRSRIADIHAKKGGALEFIVKTAE
ncbi:MAG: MaoC family dehydratase N-terminal domain-containing protein, partial [Rhodocyclales bacterium]|nr:MaoC family dehydratase N-terminal domain-containing protein [Rhodocyclales bacterium]